MINELKRQQTEVIADLHRAVKLKNETLQVISESRKILSHDKFTELMDILDFSVNKISELNEIESSLSKQIRFLILVNKDYVEG